MGTFSIVVGTLAVAVVCSVACYYGKAVIGCVALVALGAFVAVQYPGEWWSLLPRWLELTQIVVAYCGVGVVLSGIRWAVCKWRKNGRDTAEQFEAYAWLWPFGLLADVGVLGSRALLAWYRGTKAAAVWAGIVR